MDEIILYLKKKTLFIFIFFFEKWFIWYFLLSVDLFTSGHSDDPILIDRTAPVAGVVLDGSTIDEDEAFQAKTEEMCASWKSFYDPESGISQ